MIIKCLVCPHHYSLLNNVHNKCLFFLRRDTKLQQPHKNQNLIILIKTGQQVSIMCRGEDLPILNGCLPLLDDVLSWNINCLVTNIGNDMNNQQSYYVKQLFWHKTSNKFVTSISVYDLL